MTSDTATDAARLGRRVLWLLTDTVAGPAILVVAAVVTAVAVGAAIAPDPLSELPTPRIVDEQPLLPTDEEPADGWEPGERGALLLDDGTAEGDGIVDDVTDTVTDTLDDVTDTVDDTVGDVTDTVEDTLDDVSDTVDDTVDDVTDTVQDTLDDVTDPLDDATELPLP